MVFYLLSPELSPERVNCARLKYATVGYGMASVMALKLMTNDRVLSQKCSDLTKSSLPIILNSFPGLFSLDRIPLDSFGA